MDLSNRLGLETTWSGPAEVMREIASVTPSWRGVTYEAAQGRGTAVPRADAGVRRAPTFLFNESFPTADGRALFVPVEYVAPEELPNAEYPFIMNTGRQMYHWHTGTMTRRSTGLDSREPVPVVDINPRDALELGVCEGDTVRVSSRRGSMLIGARLSDRQARGQIFIPFHFREAAANLLTNPRLDPYAKIAEFKISAVRVEPAPVFAD